MSDEEKALEQALQKQQINPLDEVKGIRKAQLDQCALRRSNEIEQLLQQGCQTTGKSDEDA